MNNLTLMKGKLKSKNDKIVKNKIAKITDKANIIYWTPSGYSNKVLKSR